MPWTDVGSRRTSRLALDEVAGQTLNLVKLTRELLREHHRGHVQRTGKLECPVCVDAGPKIERARSTAGGLLW